MTNDSKTMFEKIRAFLTVYMPKQRGLSNCTIDSYRQVINQFLGFIMEKRASLTMRYPSGNGMPKRSATTLYT